MAEARISAPVVEGQKEIIEKYHEEYGINTAVRHTIPDKRDTDNGMRVGLDKVNGAPEELFESAEIACENGADVFSVESIGGKEMADYSVTNGDVVAFLFGVGYLGSLEIGRAHV